MKALTTVVARILYALPMGLFGLFHFLQGGQMKNLVPSWIPGGIFWVYVTGIVLIAACVFIIGDLKHADTMALGLAILLLIFILTIHLPGMANAATKQMSMISLLKDMGLMGGALAYAGILGKK